MKKIISVVGARPNFMKVAPLHKAFLKHTDKINHLICHTGQHYDTNMSDIFFNELGIPQPDYHLGIGSHSHGAQTGRMLEAIEEILITKNPDFVLVYGDTNSTLAGALAATKLHIPVAHVEAGLRSFNPRMPEEINRIVADRLSTLLFCPSPVSIQNLEAEGITDGVHMVGDVMYDALRSYLPRAEASSNVVGWPWRSIQYDIVNSGAG